MTVPRPEFEVDREHTIHDVGGVLNHLVIAVDGHPVIRHYPNGQSFHMAYKDERRARAMLERTRVELPNATVEVKV